MSKSWLIALYAVMASAQQVPTTPNLHLNLPTPKSYYEPGTLNWGPALNYNSSLLDQILNGFENPHTGPGDIPVWNGTEWVFFAGNTVGTQAFAETLTGIPLWITPLISTASAPSSDSVPVMGAGTQTIASYRALTGNGTKVVTANAAGTATNCAVWDSSGNIGDSGNPCAGSVTYTAPFTGGVNRSSTSKWSDQISIIDFGADPTGAANSTSAIQAALNVASSSRAGAAAYMPCGTYLLTGTATLNLPAQSLVGENESCVHLNYTGSASAIVWQMSPFTTNPAGEMSGFTLTCTSSAANGILSGQIVGSYWHDLDVSGCNNSGAAAIHLHNAGNLSTWTERNTFVNVSVGGTGTARNFHGFLLDSDNGGDSFGFNRFLDIKMNVSTAQDGFFLSSGFFYNSILTAVCNADNNAGGTMGAICFHSNGNWDSNVITLDGEWQNTGSGTGTAYAVQIESGARFANLKGSNVNVFTTGGAQLGVNNLVAASNSPNQSLVEGSSVTGWDTGTFTLNTVTTTPQPTQRANYGSLGLLVGTNVESPYVSMFNGSANKFLVGTVPTSDNIGQMIDVFDVDTFGEATAYGKMFVSPDGRISGGSAPGSIDGNAALNVGAYTSAHRSGFTNTYLLSTNGINESMSADPNFSGGWGFVEGTNIAHPMAWAYTLDPNDFEIYEKSFQTPLITSSLVAAITHGGNAVLKGHLNQQTGSNNIAGTCAVAGATSCSFTFTVAFNSAPVCTATPYFEMASAGAPRWWISNPTTTACTVNFEAAQTGTIGFTVAGNPN